MKHQLIDYTVENIGQIFSFLKKSIRTGQRRAYRIEADGVEIIPLTNSLDPFSDFLNFSYPQCSRIGFFIYGPDGVLEYKYEFDLEVHAQRLARIETILRENKHLCLRTTRLEKRVQALMESEQRWIKMVMEQDKENKRLKEKASEGEKIGEGKVVDAGDCFVVFVP